jgi:multiple sugar transport system permease protein
MSHQVRGRLKRAEQRAALGFISPWLVGFLMFTIGPIIASIYLSFTNYDALTAPKFIGLDNYKVMFFKDPSVWKSLSNTFYMLIGIPISLAISLILALALNHDIRGIRTYRTLLYLPSIVPTVANSILWLWILQPQFGLLNSTLAMLHIRGPMWLGDPAWAKPALILMSLWGVGPNIIIYLAGLKNIPSEFYDAAIVDGAVGWNLFRHITFPLLTPTIFYTLVVGVINTLQTFTQAFIMTGGGPVESTYFYMLHLYNNAFAFFKMGYASALAWFLCIIIAIFTYLQFKVASYWVYY